MRTHLRNFINDTCIFRCPPNHFLKGCNTGEAYVWQFYLRRAIFNQHMSYLISRWLLDNHNPDYQYAAMETAGPPMLSNLMGVAMLGGIQIDGFAIRKDRKKYGLFNYIEGSVSNKPVIILDDLANSKTTILRAANICRTHNLEVVGAHTIVNKKSNVDFIDGIPVKSMFNIDDFDMTWEEYYKDRKIDVSVFIETYKNVLYARQSESVVVPLGTDPMLLEGWNKS